MLHFLYFILCLVYFFGANLRVCFFIFTKKHFFTKKVAIVAPKYYFSSNIFH